MQVYTIKLNHYNIMHSLDSLSAHNLIMCYIYVMICYVLLYCVGSVVNFPISFYCADDSVCAIVYDYVLG